MIRDETVTGPRIKRRKTVADAKEKSFTKESKLSSMSAISSDSSRLVAVACKNCLSFSACATELRMVLCSQRARNWPYMPNDRNSSSAAMMFILRIVESIWFKKVVRVVLSKTALNYS